MQTKPTDNSTASSLFIGLQSYTEAQAHIFFGRDEEIDKLTNLVKANTLTIVFGKSGTGKTSLLNAGVFPRLRKEYFLPFRIRLEFDENSPDLVTQIKTVLKAEIDQYGFRVEAYPGDETLWEYFHREPLWKSVTPILIFDQFEEIFTLGRKSETLRQEDLSAFWEELADLIENSIPETRKQALLNNKEGAGFSYKTSRVKTVFSFREEFLPEFEGVTARIPSIKYSRFRLMPMNGHQAYQVITKTWKNNIDAEQAHKIVGFFSSEDGKSRYYDLLQIEPSLLSQVCSFLDRERLKEGNQNISDDFLHQHPKEKILRAIYNQVLLESNDAVLQNETNKDGFIYPANVFLEEKLITDEGFRIKYTLSEYDKKLIPAIGILKSKYFVRQEGKTVELTHDVLTPLIKADREVRRKQEAMVVARKKANRRAVYIVLFSVVAAGLLWFITTDRAVKAIQERDRALQDKKALDSLIRKDSASLAFIDASILKSKKELEKLKKGETGDPAITDTTAIQFYMQRLQNDSLEIESKKAEITGLLKQRTGYEENVATYKKQLAAFAEREDSLRGANRFAGREITSLKRQLADAVSSLSLLQNNHNKLHKDFDSYIHQVSQPFTDDTAEIVHSGTNGLELDLYYSIAKRGESKIPANLKIYLLPDIAANKKLIRSAKTYEINCDELNFERASGRRLARYRNGKYRFYDLPPGKYFVKICTYYGGFYTFTKAAGNETVEWDISPPIR